jgi:anaerobic selenocysteine-containing dehydrogenase
VGGARRRPQEQHLSAADRDQLRDRGSRTSSNRAIQWGEQIVKPIFESKDDNEVMYLLAKKLGFADTMFKNIKVENNVPVAEDISARSTAAAGRPATAASRRSG